VAEQTAKYKEKQTRKLRIENRYDDMVRDSGLSVNDLKKQVKEAREKYGISSLDFKNNRFWDVPEEESERLSKQILKEKKEQAREARIDAAAAEARKEFILAPSDILDEENLPENHFPAPVRAACALLGHPLPAGATMDKRLTEYIGGLMAPSNQYGWQ
jgi:hypothetical protein